MIEWARRMMDALESVQCTPLLVLGLTPEGRWQMAIHPDMRTKLADPKVREAVIKSLSTGVERIATAPMDDLTWR